MHLDAFLYTLIEFHLNPPSSRPVIYVGDFNMDMLNVSPQSKNLENYMTHYNFKLLFSKSITTYDSQIDHLWTSCYSRCT